jgi:hypothetical protein
MVPIAASLISSMVQPVGSGNDCQLTSHWRDSVQRVEYAIAQADPIRVVTSPLKTAEWREFGVSDEIGVMPNDRTAPLRQPRKVGVYLFVLALSLIAAGAAYAWVSHRALIEAITSSVTSPVAETTARDEASGLDELRSEQQQVAARLERIDQNVSAGQAELKRLSDQIAGLLDRVDALQKSTVPPAPPPVVSPPAVPQAVVAPRKQVAAKKPPPTPASPPPQSVGPVSVGGAPLADPGR